MRVLMTTDTVGGVWTYTRELTEGLIGRGCDVTLMSMGRMPSAEQRAWADGLEVSSSERFAYVPTEFKLEWMQDGADCLDRSREAVTACARDSRADVLHTNQFCYGALELGIPKVVAAHSDVWSWWAACRGGEPEATAWSGAYRRTVTRGLDGADVVVAPTAWMADQITVHYPNVASPRVIANGRASRGSGAGGGTPIERRMQAITCGRLWDEGKGVRLLEGIDAGMPLLLAGECQFEGGVDPAESGLTFLGRLSEKELEDQFRRSAIYVVTSRYEPFGLAPVEAALAGCAIVANDIASLREVWGEAAVYFERNSAVSLTAILRELAGDPERVTRMAEAAGGRARERYTAERMTTAYLALYGELLAGRARRHVA